MSDHKFLTLHLSIDGLHSNLMCTLRSISGNYDLNHTNVTNKQKEKKWGGGKYCFTEL